MDTIHYDTTDNTLHTMHLQKHKQTKALTEGQTGRYKQSDRVVYYWTTKQGVTTLVHTARQKGVSREDASHAVTIVCCSCLLLQAVLSRHPWD